MATISDLSQEIIENIYLHLGYTEQADRQTIHNGLLVSRLFYSAVRRAPLLDTVIIKRTQQIPQLVSYLTRNLVQAQYIKRLKFDILPSEWTDAGTVPGDLRITNDLSPITFLLNLAVNIRHLVDVPILKTHYSTVLLAILTLSPLFAISLRQYGPPLDALLRPLTMADIHSICSKLPADKSNLFLFGYDIILPPELSVLRFPASPPC